jgi:hypothetical protein
MSDRERWIVYPLLLLTLGLALRDKFGAAKEVRAHRIICEELVVSNEEIGPQVVLESTKSGGVVRTISSDRTMQLVLGHEDNTASLFCETATADGTATRALLGDLRRLNPQRLVRWLGEWPLLDPRLNRIAQPAVDEGTPKPAK